MLKGPNRARFLIDFRGPSAIFFSSLIECKCRYIFPGLALGAHLGNTSVVTDLMIMAVAEALPRMLSDEERQRRAVYPDLANIRAISANMAVEARCLGCPILLCVTDVLRPLLYCQQILHSLARQI